MAVTVALLASTIGAGGEPSGERVPELGRSAGSADQASVYSDEEGRARTSVFGATGVGYKFVYVFDRSSSMAVDHGRPLKAVKAELLASLKDLDSVHQFQIVFYNEKPTVFNPGGSGRLAFANQANKDRAERFIDRITADGNTQHDTALKLAIRLRPDVIFFLTDGDDPKLSRSQLDQIQRMASGIAIHAIEFGQGPKPAAKSFLATLAEDNGGQYVYVDLAKALTTRRE